MTVSRIFMLQDGKWGWWKRRVSSTKSKGLWQKLRSRNFQSLIHPPKELVDLLKAGDIFLPWLEFMIEDEQQQQQSQQECGENLTSPTAPLQ